MTYNAGLRMTPRRAYRSADDRLLSGVAAGVAEHLGLPVNYIRVFFLVAAAFGGMGIMLYGGLWLYLPLNTQQEAGAPGIEAATRQGKRPGRAARIKDLGPLISLGAIALGIIAVGHLLWSGSLVFWPLVVGLCGVVVLWWQSDEAQRERWLDGTGRVSLLRAVVGSGGWASYARLAVGLGLLLTAIVLFGVQSGEVSVARDVIIAGALGIGGIALTLGPWLVRLSGELSDERAARIRQQERADVAAHLHDSVLQTLALIQKHASDGRTVSTLARAQERDLRQWLYGDEVPSETTVASALRVAAAEVEDGHGVPVEVVTVGDVASSERTTPLVKAAREAMVNAAKHSASTKVDVYAELSASRAEVFVRDRGQGFVLGEVAGDRLGVSNSIIGRMERHGGSADIRTAPGDGTEVRLAMDLEEKP
ncbi:MAG TPA: PspC domain-containing protein [Nocardioidaceae bacterium]|nr:PspC domain-containing protein [Nocardioidaceae bacterium]